MTTERYFRISIPLSPSLLPLNPSHYYLSFQHFAIFPSWSICHVDTNLEKKRKTDQITPFLHQKLLMVFITCRMNSNLYYDIRPFKQIYSQQSFQPLLLLHPSHADCVSASWEDWTFSTWAVCFPASSWNAFLWTQLVRRLLSLKYPSLKALLAPLPPLIRVKFLLCVSLCFHRILFTPLPSMCLRLLLLKTFPFPHQDVSCSG